MKQYVADNPAPYKEPVGDVVLSHDYSEAVLVEYLGALAQAAGSAVRAVKLLHDRGYDEVTRGELEVLRERHTALYMALADERSRAVEEGIAQSYRELVVGAQRVTKAYVDQLAADVEDGNMPKDLDRSIMALSKVLQTSTDKLLSITGRPVAGQSRDPLESLRELERLGVAVPRTALPVDGEAVEVTDE